MIKKIFYTAFIASLFSINSQAVENINDLFLYRLDLRTKATEINSSQIKNTMTKIRYAEDLLGEKMMGNQRIKVSAISEKAFSNPLYTSLNPKVSVLNFQSGDVIVLRGMSTISTTLSEMPETPSQFSHTLIIYTNKTDGITYGIEALVDKGVVIHTLNEILSEGVPRMILYRYHDSIIADQAGKIAYDLALKSINQGQNYPYDFKLDLSDYSQVYCAELIRMAFDLATQGKTILPAFPSLVGPKLKNTLKTLQIPLDNKVVYAPPDIDLEPNFELIAEWRDFKATLNYRIKDQILLKIFEWIEDGSLNLDYGKILTLAKSNKQNQPLDIKKLSALADMVNKVVNQLTNQILVANDNLQVRTGRNMSEEEIQNYLESIKDQLLLHRP